jgi:hypothetical protein
MVSDAAAAYAAKEKKYQAYISAKKKTEVEMRKERKHNHLNHGWGLQGKRVVLFLNPELKAKSSLWSFAILTSYKGNRTEFFSMEINFLGC